MGTFARSVVVKRPRAALFAIMQDYGRRLEWDPFLSEARLVDAEAAGLGVKAWCVDHAGRGMETEYVSFQPPERVAVKMTRGPWMFRSFAGSWVYEEFHAERGVSSLGLEDKVPIAPSSDERNSILDLFRR